MAARADVAADEQQAARLREAQMVPQQPVQLGGVAFVAADGPVAMIHAIEILPGFRRKGMATWLIRKAAEWAQAQGATRLALAVSRRNTSARALYDRIGFAEIGGYGYWVRH